MTLSRSQGSGRPKKLDNVITPSRMEIAGAMVKVALETAVFFNTAAVKPSSFALRQALMRK